MRSFLSFPFVLIGGLILFIGFIIRFGLVSTGNLFEGFTVTIAKERKSIGK